MSNKSILQTNNEALSSNNLDLQALIDQANALPDAINGVELNFEVVGGTSQPSNPKENTIWINTSTTITGYKFDTIEPENMNEGEVWIYVGSNSTVAFDIVDGVKMHPLSVKQYISGSWVNVTAMTYQSGKWIEWRDYLFNYSSQSYAWQCRGLRYYTSSSNHGGVTPSCVTNSDGSVTISMTNNGTVMMTGGCYELVQDYDLTNKNKIIIEYATATGGTWLTVNNRSDPQWANYIACVRLTETANTKTELDVSSITGLYDIMVYLYRNKSNSGTGTEKITIKRIYVE